jgi:hypothetical protein
MMEDLRPGRKAGGVTVGHEGARRDLSRQSAVNPPRAGETRGDDHSGTLHALLTDRQGDAIASSVSARQVPLVTAERT